MNASSDTKSSTKNIHDLSDKIYTSARALKYALCMRMQLHAADMRIRAPPSSSLRIETWDEDYDVYLAARTKIWILDLNLRLVYATRVSLGAGAYVFAAMM